MEIEITILKFNEVSKRREIKRPTWFAVDNDIFNHPDFFKLTGDEFRCWIWILSIASKVNKDKVRLDSEVFAHQCRCSEKVFFATIQKLKGKRIHGETSPPEGEISPIHYTTLHNTTDTTLHNSSSTVAVKTPRVVEVKDLPVFKNEIELAQAIPTPTIERWSRLYPDQEFLGRELLKAFNYYENNPRKKPKVVKGWVQALSSWFERGWVKHVVTIKGEPGSAINWDQVFEKRTS